MVTGLRIHDAVMAAVAEGRPAVALETAVASHGLPSPQNLDVMESMRREILDTGAEPAICLVQGGHLHVGASLELVESVASDPDRLKASVCDLGYCLARRAAAGLTVSATLFAAHLAGIAVFATGGIGGVHLGAEKSGDVSADLLQLSLHPVLTVCSGAKSVLDMPRTLEHLEALGVPTYAFGTSYFPAFYLRSCGIASPRIDSSANAAALAKSHWGLGQRSGVIIGNPVSEDHALDDADWARWLLRAQRESDRAGIVGKAVTPYLLARVAEYSGGQTVQANIELLKSNARLAGEIAVALTA